MNSELVQKVLFLLQLYNFGCGFVSPPRWVLFIHTFVVLPRLAGNYFVSLRNRLFGQALL